MADRRLLVNGAFLGQRVTGQQRYATEITSRLVEAGDVEVLRPSAATASSVLRSWAWTLAGLPFAARRDVLLSLTSRAPAGHRRHVVVVHDLFVLTDPQWYSRKYVATHAPLLRATLAQAAHVVAVSQPVADQVQAEGLTRAPVSVAPNAPSDVFRDAPPRASTRDLPPAGQFLLVVGSLDPRKNLTALLTAYESLPLATRREHPLVVVGAGAAIFRAAELRPVEGVVMAGYVDDETLAGLYADARGVVFPSLAEGFGLPLVEAAMAGATVAASDIPVFRWIAGEHVHWFDPRSIDSMAAAMVHLLEQGPPADGDLAREVSRRFSWDASARTVLEACERVAGTGR